MLFASTLRRKLMVGVGLVLVMLLVLSSSGIWGLSSYQKLVRNLDQTLNHAPQPADLVKAIGTLFEPLLQLQQFHDRPLRDAGAEQVAQEWFAERLNETGTRVLEYRRRFDALPEPLTYGTRPLIDAILGGIEAGQASLAAQHQRLIDSSDADERREVIEEMLSSVAHSLTQSLRLPDLTGGLSQTLADAEHDYESSLTLVWSASATALVLFLGLLRSGYVGIFHPLRQLHQGALRVAHGDFDYRVQLKTRDEMAELAQAFNDMTTRFQEIRADLDRQVQERSRQLVRSERLAGVGFLAAGVAHEINNPLSAIAMAAESLEERLADLLARSDHPESPVVAQYLRMIQSESFRCRQITERLLDFSRGREAVRESVDLARLTGEVVAMVQYLSKFRDKKIVFQPGGACLAEVNAAEIKQVVLNLVANGLEAMSLGGTLTIALIEQTDHVLLEFRDEGCGMTAEVLDNMFEPFFTRKQNGQGTGLGLSISHRIVAEHGGTIAAASPGPGLGSTFSLRLPRLAKRSAAA
ncbi:MAG: sensor histidine kinase [Planctomycetaceae bacterium]